MNSLILLVVFLVIITLIAVIPNLLTRFHIPAVVSIMIIGIIIGPHSIDLIGFINKQMGRGFPDAQLYMVLDAMGLLGLVFLMALAGMETDIRIIRNEKKAVASLSIMTFIIPAVTGYFVYAYFKPYDFIGKLLYASLFASHSVGIVFPIIRELKVVRTRFGIAVLASTIITDVASLILLAICVQLKRHSLTNDKILNSISIFDKLSVESFGGQYNFITTFMLVVFIFFIIVILILPPILDKIFIKTESTDDKRLTLFLLVVLIIVFLGELIGVSVVVGAFIAGMALVRVKSIHQNNRLLHKKLEGLGYGLLVPFLFLTIGMKTDVAILFSAKQSMAIVLFTVCGLIISKIISGWLALMFAGFNSKKGLCAGLMTVPQLSATLAAAAVGYELNIIEPVSLIRLSRFPYSQLYLSPLY